MRERPGWILKGGIGDQSGHSWWLSGQSRLIREHEVIGAALTASATMVMRVHVDRDRYATYMERRDTLRRSSRRVYEFFFQLQLGGPCEGRMSTSCIEVSSESCSYDHAHH